MKRMLKTALVTISSIRLIPHLAVLMLMLMSKRNDVHADIDRWHRQNLTPKNLQNLAVIFCWLMTFYPEFRVLFYFRGGLKAKLFAPLCPPMNSLHILTGKIGPGLFIQHGFATIIATKSIGANCWINQQVTIGFSNATDCPTIGDNVTINAGAKIIGNVTIGNNARIGAGAVVVKNVPANCTVVGNPARIVRRDGVRIDQPL